MKKAGAFFPVTLISLSLLLLAAACGGGEENPFGVESELVTGAVLPQALAFAPDGRLFYAEQDTGKVGIVTPEGDLLPEPFVIAKVASAGAGGLTGLALDPDFETNGYVYILFLEPAGREEESGTVFGRPVLVRFTDENNKGVNRKTIVGDLPDTNPDWPGVNGSGGLHFGPDGFLYFTLGDFNLPGPGGLPRSLDFDTPIGKMLRIDKDGEAPPDNPFVDDPDADPRIFARGFSKAFDFAFHPEGGQLYGTDNTGSCEELNLVKPGGNYGWPEVGEFPWPDCFAGEQIKGIHFFSTEDKTPGEFASIVHVLGMGFVSGDVYPLLGDSLLACEGDTKLMRRLVLTGSNFDKVAADEEGVDNIVVEDCVFDVATSPDGIVYYSNETEIRRLVPIAQEEQ